MASSTPSLPNDWKAVLDKETSAHYYVNDTTKVAQWEDPRFYAPAKPEEVTKYYPLPPPLFPVDQAIEEELVASLKATALKPKPEKCRRKKNDLAQKIEELRHHKGLSPVLSGGPPSREPIPKCYSTTSPSRLDDAVEVEKKPAPTPLQSEVKTKQTQSKKQRELEKKIEELRNRKGLSPVLMQDTTSKAKPKASTHTTSSTSSTSDYTTYYDYLFDRGYDVD